MDRERKAFEVEHDTVATDSSLICSKGACLLATAIVCGFLLWFATRRTSIVPDDDDGGSGDSPAHVVKLLLIGDSGRAAEFRGTQRPFRQGNASKERGFINQTLVARDMASVAQDLRPEAIIHVGDVFYTTGLQGIDDDQFDVDFAEVFSEKVYPSLNVSWYSVLGNHEYLSDNVSCHLDPALRQRDKRWFAFTDDARTFGRRTDMPDAPLVEIVFFDTSPFIEGYHVAPKYGPGIEFDFSMQLQRKADPSNEASWRRELQRQLDALEARLAAAEQRNSRWLIVVGHHPIRSHGDHGDQPELVALLDPILWRHGVHAYFNGHDHHMQHEAWLECCTIRQVQAPPLQPAGPARVVINEVSDNQNFIELYNLGDTGVDLQGWKLMNQKGSTYTLGRGNCHENHTISARKYLVITHRGACGYKFRTKSNDAISLIDTTGTVVSDLQFGFLGASNAGCSFGLFPDGVGQLQSMPPSMGSPNKPAPEIKPFAPKNAPRCFNRTGLLPSISEVEMERASETVFRSVHYFTIGNGAKLGHHFEPIKHARPESENNLRFYARERGFASLNATTDELIVTFFGPNAQALHKHRLGPGPAIADESLIVDE